MLEGAHLLIAEDNPTNQIVVAKIVQQLGGSFDLASNGVEAIQLFDPEKHDLALLDIEMPKKSGLEVIRYIRDRKDTPREFPIVALTAFVLAEHRAKILDAGANAILAKPIIDIEKFGEELSAHLRGGTVEIETRVGGLRDMASSLGDEVMPELIASLTSDLTMIRSQLAANLSEEDADTESFRHSAHTLTSLGKMSGDMGLAELSSECEAQAHTLKPTCIKAKSEQMISGIDVLLAEIQEFERQYQ